MAVLKVRTVDNQFEARFDLSRDSMTLGRDAACDIVLPRTTISKRHAQLNKTGDSFEISDLGSLSGIYVNGARVKTHALKNGDKLILGDVLLVYETGEGKAAGDLSAESTGVGLEVEEETTGARKRPEGVGGAEKDEDYNATIQLDRALLADKAASGPPPPEKRKSGDSVKKSGGGGTQQIDVAAVQQRRKKEEEGGGGQNIFVDRFKGKKRGPTDPYTKLRAAVHEELVERVRLKRAAGQELVADQELWVKARTAANQIIYELEKKGELRGVDPKVLLKDVLDEALGLGPIQEFLEDPSIEEIMVNGPYNIYVARRGKTEKTEKKYIDDERLLTAINRITAPLGRPINQSRPLVDARLADGSRVNAIIPPVSLIGPVLTIRKFPSKPLTPQDLVNFGAMSPAMLKFLEMAVHNRLNILIAGGTAAGKTTLLNVVSSFIPSNERILTIEDSAELQLQQPHVISLETRPAGSEGTAEVNIRDLVKNALRMRPDRIIVGECRSGETIDMLQAMNTGHDGSLTTGHANSARDMLSRTETMCLMAGLDLPLSAIREQIARALNLIVFVERFPDGKRRISEIIEVLGLEDERYNVADIYSFEYKLDREGKLHGRFVARGYIPRFIERLKERGVDVPLEIFQTI